MPAPGIDYSVRSSCIAPLFGWWFLGVFVGPALITPSEHGSIFILQPALFLAIAGGVLHSAWVLVGPSHLLAALGPSMLLACLATFVALVGTALFWNESLSSVIANAAPIAGGMLGLSLITAGCISVLYIGRKLKTAKSEVTSAP